MNQEQSQHIQKIREARKPADPQRLLDDLLSGNTVALSRAITLTESNTDADRHLAGILLNQAIAHSGKSIRIGVTGLPGAGKSTFIEALGTLLVERGKKVAVLAIDPSSEAGKGSILGDRTRMPVLSASPNAFIRPSPSSGVLGGVGVRTREAMLLCEAAGYDVILVETVGVGQSETEVHGMTDLFLLLLLAGGGDELQGIKRGIMEMADIVLINKADGDNLERAKATRQEIGRALHFLPGRPSGWKPQTLVSSSLQREAIEAVWKTIEQFFQTVKENGFFESNRKAQQLEWFHEQIRREVMSRYYADDKQKQQIAQLEEAIRSNQLSVREALGRMFPD